MRRVLPVIALAALLWPQAMMLACALTTTTAHASHTSHPSHTATEVASLEHEGHTQECPAVMACHTVMIEAAGPSGDALPVAPPLVESRPATRMPATAILTADPPPPRRSA